MYESIITGLYGISSLIKNKIYAIIILIIGSIVSFITSILAIKFLISYIKKHDFTVFGIYRIILGIIILLTLL